MTLGISYIIHTFCKVMLISYYWGREHNENTYLKDGIFFQISPLGRIKGKKPADYQRVSVAPPGIEHFIYIKLLLSFEFRL